MAGALDVLGVHRTSSGKPLASVAGGSQSVPAASQSSTSRAVELWAEDDNSRSPSFFRDVLRTRLLQRERIKRPGLNPQVREFNVESHAPPGGVSDSTFRRFVESENPHFTTPPAASAASAEPSAHAPHRVCWGCPLALQRREPAPPDTRSTTPPPAIYAARQPQSRPAP